ncbi:zinc transporter 2 [Phalaenopsis equestris]|uniref:zinc transporter 2 n=1 Tax=Phalaenopsis equestris TaxID=78828 RepID=UPI0009E33CE9|nr:zinc transporter 2 [Phalaenopsis equestris]
MSKPSPLLPFLLLALVLSASSHGGHDDAAAADSDSPPPNLRSRSLILVKIWCLIIVFTATFAGGISPYFFKWNEAFIAFGTLFAGGVFLGTALMHFLSDSNSSFEDLTDKEYPFAFMLASAGYLVTMLADCVVTGVVARGRTVRDVQGGKDQQNQSGQNELGSQTQPEDGGVHAHGQSVKSGLYEAASLGDNILLIVALCFHSVFEGIAIGVAENKADAWKALWTVCLHKIFAAIAMGIALLGMMPNRPLLSCTAYSFAFAISSPVGVAIGIIIDATTEGRVADWIYAISMGLACGVFIYVSINHLLSKGYKPLRPIAADTPLTRWMAVTVGVGVIAVVMIWDT